MSKKWFVFPLKKQNKTLWCSLWYLFMDAILSFVFLSLYCLRVLGGLHFSRVTLSVYIFLLSRDCPSFNLVPLLFWRLVPLVLFFVIPSFLLLPHPTPHWCLIDFTPYYPSSKGTLLVLLFRMFEFLKQVVNRGESTGEASLKSHNWKWISPVEVFCENKWECLSIHQ